MKSSVSERSVSEERDSEVTPGIQISSAVLKIGFRTMQENTLTSCTGFDTLGWTGFRGDDQ